jgi:hypothetical protein
MTHALVTQMQSVLLGLVLAGLLLAGVELGIRRMARRDAARWIEEPLDADDEDLEPPAEFVHRLNVRRRSRQLVGEIDDELRHDAEEAP